VSSDDTKEQESSTTQGGTHTWSWGEPQLRLLRRLLLLWHELRRSLVGEGLLLLPLLRPLALLWHRVGLLPQHRTELG
jgi:hypothetical protein